MNEALKLEAANNQSNAANKSSLRKVRAHVVEVRKNADGTTEINKLRAGPSEPGASQALSEDAFTALAEAGRVIEPPFDLLTLAMLPEHSSELGQCIDAMKANIDGYGFRLVSRLIASLKIDEDDQAPEVEAARIEFANLMNFFTYATQESFTEFRRKLRHDIETTGNGYYEVLRDESGEICGFTHLKSYQMRLGREDEEAMLVERKVVHLEPDGSISAKKIKQWRRFRRFVQSRSIHRSSLSTVGGFKVRWFKEFGDPRNLDKDTGEFESSGVPGQPDKVVAVNKRASEVVHVKIYSARSPYGIPRYIGNLLSIFGDRAAEEINYVTFKNNNIPSMVIAVSNGQLTEGTIARIQSFVESQIQGSDNYSKFLIMEAEPFGDEGEDGGQTKIDITPLVKDQHKDALFQNYSANNQDKIRRAFRLPALFVGKSEGYNRATAEADRRLADEQIFSPERDEFDQQVNRFIFPELGIIYHKFKTNSPNTTDNAQLVKILAGSEKTGGMTPRIARRVMGEVLNMDLPEFTSGFPADKPFSLTMAEAVKNRADPAEPGQQVTAIRKTVTNELQALGILGNDPVDLSDDADADAGLDYITKRIVEFVQKQLAAQAAE
jgi:PBSX family phage portal protein